jgi:hypothetical protein
MISLKYKTILLILLFLSSSSRTWAGWVIERVIYSVPVNSEGSSKQKIKSIFYFSKNRLKSLQGNSGMIVNYNNNQVFAFNPAKRLYWGGTIDDYINEINRSVSQSKERIKESLNNMPPEQRKAIEEEMKKQGIRVPSEADQPNMKVKVKIERTSDKKDIAGYDATRYKIYTDGVLYQELWVTEDVDVYKEIDMKKMNDFQFKVNETLSSLYSGKDASVESSLEYQKIFERGYPLKTIQFLGPNQAIIEVVSAKEIGIADSEFEVAKSFSKATLQEVMKMDVGK